MRVVKLKQKIIDLLLVVFSFQIICSKVAEDYSSESPDGTRSRCVVDTFFPALSGSGSSSTHWADVRNSCMYGGKREGREREGRRRSGRRRSRGKKTFTFCGFLGSGQRPRIPHATHKVSIRLNPTLHQKASPLEKSLSPPRRLQAVAEVHAADLQATFSIPTLPPLKQHSSEALRLRLWDLFSSRHRATRRKFDPLRLLLNRRTVQVKRSQLSVAVSGSIDVTWRG